MVLSLIMFGVLDSPRELWPRVDVCKLVGQNLSLGPRPCRPHENSSMSYFDFVTFRSSLLTRSLHVQTIGRQNI